MNVSSNSGNGLLFVYWCKTNKEERKKEFKYYCELCDFGNFSKGLFKLHMETKHINL